MDPREEAEECTTKTVNTHEFPEGLAVSAIAVYYGQSSYNFCVAVMEVEARFRSVQGEAEHPEASYIPIRVTCRIHRKWLPLLS